MVAFLFFIFNKSSASAIGQMKERKDIKIRKGKDKCIWSLFIIDIIVYIEKSKRNLR